MPEETRTKFHIETIDTVAVIDPQAWDRLAARRSLYLSHGWLKFVDQDSGCRVCHLVAKDGEGRLLAACPAYVMDAPPRNPMFDLHYQFAVPTGLASAAETWFPALLIGGLGYCGGLLFDDQLVSGSDRAGIMAEFVSRFQSMARTLECRASALMYLDRPTALEIQPLAGDDALVLASLPDTCLSIQWSNFEGYIADLPKNRRSSARQEQARFDRAGYTTTVGDFEGWAEPGARLIAETNGKHGSATSWQEIKARLILEADCLSSEGGVFLCKRGTLLQGIVVTRSWNDTLYVRTCGFDRSIGSAAEYFVVSFYEPIRFAIANGIARVNFGPLAYRPKLLRGIQAEPRFSVLLKFPDRPEGLREKLSNWNQAMQSAWDHDFALYSTASVDLSPA